jgi:FPC/CPF motif-containing protein YcgG
MAILTPEQALSLYGTINPFATPAALRSSNYSANIGGTLIRLLDWHRPSGQAVQADRAMRAFILSRAFSCVAGKAAVASGGYRFGYYRGFSDVGSTEGLAHDLAAFVAERPSMDVEYASFVAVFEEPLSGDEKWFEAGLWRQLQRLADLGAPYYGWDASVSDVADDPNFAFSFAGHAFFVVGLHPRSSRKSRRFVLPAIAFNAHRQFAAARRAGHFERIQRLVRNRELALQGSINPELREFGTCSEARQYSGRAMEEQWKCPFRAPS